MVTGLTVLLTALLSSVLTWVVAYIFYRTHLERHMDERLTRMQSEFESRVKSGVHAAGLELLPAMREQVRLGFQDALGKSSAVGLVEDTARVVSTGAGLVESSLSALLNLGKPKK